MTAELLNRTEVAKLLGVEEPTIEGWEKRGLLTPEKPVRGHQGEVT